MHRRPGEDSDGDYFRDSCSDASSDSEHERCLNYLREQKSHHHLRSEIPFRMDRLSLKGQRNTLQEGFSSDEGESGNAEGCLMFEYLERDQPHGRVPLPEKASFCFPHLLHSESLVVFGSYAFLYSYYHRCQILPSFSSILFFWFLFSFAQVKVTLFMSDALLRICRLVVIAATILCTVCLNISFA